MLVSMGDQLASKHFILIHVLGHKTHIRPHNFDISREYSGPYFVQVSMGDQLASKQALHPHKCDWP